MKIGYIEEKEDEIFPTFHNMINKLNSFSEEELSALRTISAILNNKVNRVKNIDINMTGR
jgi:hypothetical protein